MKQRDGISRLATESLDQRRTLFLEAARTLFLERGYRATTLNDVVERSGGSLATLYRLFQNKTGLLVAVVERRCDAIPTLFDRVELRDAKPAATLRAIADEIFERLPESVSLLRLVIAESIEEPELGRLLYERGILVIERKLTKLLEQLHALGILHIPSPAQSAVLFHRIVIGQYEIRSLLNLAVHVAQDERDRHLDAVVNMFVFAHRPETC